jgi:glycopeptide antibiotics resistance protein
MLGGWVIWPYAVLAAALVWRWGMAACTPRRTLAARVVLVLYLGWLASETFFPLPVAAAALRGGAAARPGGGLHADLVPFDSIAHLLALGLHWPTVRLLVGNVAVFVPFGLLVQVAWAALATWRRLLLAALALSVTIELGQLAVSLLVGYSYRVTEVDDVVLNVAGVLLGWAAWSALGRRADGRRVDARAA